MKKLLLAVLLLAGSAFAGTDLKTGVSYFTFTAAMDTAGTVRSLIRNDTLYTPWYYVGDMKRVRIAVRRVPAPLAGYKDSSWATNVNDTTKLLIQYGFNPERGTPIAVAARNGIRTIPVDSSLTNSAVVDTTLIFTAAQTNLFHRDSGAVIPDYIRGMVVIHDSTKTTIASSGLVGNKYARQFIFFINGFRNDRQQ